MEVMYVSKMGADIKVITNYLNAEGLYPSSPKIVSDMYSMYSEERYSAGWMYVDDIELAKFTSWLKEFCSSFNLYSEEI